MELIAHPQIAQLTLVAGMLLIVVASAQAGYVAGARRERRVLKAMMKAEVVEAVTPAPVAQTPAAPPGEAANAQESTPAPKPSRETSQPQIIAGRLVNPDGTVVHLRQLNSAQAIAHFVQWMRDEADRPADSNSPEDVLERCFYVSWMLPADCYAAYQFWCGRNAVIAESHRDFMSLMQEMPGVIYQRRRLHAPELQHLLAQARSDRAWVVRVRSNHEVAAADRRAQAASGSDRSRTGRAGPSASRKRAQHPVQQSFFADHGGPDMAMTVARAA